MAARTAPWLALGGGGLAWSAHLLTGYFLVALGCPRTWPLDWLIAAVTLIAAAVALATGVLSLIGWRRAPARGDATAILYGAGVLLAGLFTIAILLGGTTALILPACQGVAIGG
ncbi:MAG TPA: hypothetical protein VIE36_01105 [Methylomirabilota bacterium]|jgi:hypothetical protein